MSPKVVCQQSFFTLALYLSAASKFLLRLLHLPLGPRLHRLLAQPADLFDQPHFGRIGFLQIPGRIVYHRQQCRYPVLDLRVRVEPPQNRLVAQLRRFLHRHLPE